MTTTTEDFGGILMQNSPAFRRMVTGYRVCLLWVMPGDDECENPGDNKSLSDFSFAANVQTSADCLEFLQRLNRQGLLDPLVDLMSDERIGHDFALTRNGHGAGFWDRNELDVMTDGVVPVNLGDAVSDIARAMHERDLYIGDDGMVYSE